MRLITIIACSFLMLSGCSTINTPNDEAATHSQLPQTLPSKASESFILHVSPSPLFEGEEEKYRPFLGLHSGAVKLRYEGNRTGLKIELEQWEEGKFKKIKHSMTNNISHIGSKGGSFDGEFMISVKEENIEGKPPQYVITSSLFQKGKGYTSTESRMDKNPNFSMQSPIPLEGSLNIAEDESVAVWGLQATDENSMSSYSSLDETLKQAKWALVVRVSVVE